MTPIPTSYLSRDHLARAWVEGDAPSLSLPRPPRAWPAAPRWARLLAALTAAPARGLRA